MAEVREVRAVAVEEGCLSCMVWMLEGEGEDESEEDCVEAE